MRTLLVALEHSLACRSHNAAADQLANQAITGEGWTGLVSLKVGAHQFVHFLMYAWSDLLCDGHKGDRASRRTLHADRYNC